MNVEDIRSHAIAKKDVTESFPFGESTLVFKVNGKIFLLVGMDHQPLQFNVKCDPERAEELRGQYDCIIPGYHMNKKHWNTVVLTGQLPWEEVQDLIRHSYELVKE